MPSLKTVFLRGSYATLAGLWAGLGGAAGFALLPLVDGWLPIPVGLALGGYVALYLAYHNAEEARGRLDQEIDSIKRNHARDVEWNQAIETFRGQFTSEISAQLKEEPGLEDVWSFFGGGEAHHRALRTACSVAGHALSLSKARLTLPDSIRMETDPCARWLAFVGLKDGFDGTSGSGRDTTGTVPREWTTRGIRDIAIKSKRLCEDCRNSESFL